MTENLKDLTHDAHHSAQETVLGTAIMEGTITPYQYYIWLYIQKGVHDFIDGHLPAFCGRTAEFNKDLLEMELYGGLTEERLFDASEALETLFDPINYYFLASPPTMRIRKLHGAAYIMLGAHLMGGPKNKKKLDALGLPTHHLTFKEGTRHLAREYLFYLRDKPELADISNEFFTMIRDIMDKIE